MFIFQPLPIAASLALIALLAPAPAPLSPAPAPLAPFTDPECDLLGPVDVCVGQQVTYTSVQSGSNFTWTFTYNPAGAVFCGPTNGQSVCVVASQPGYFRLLVNYTNATGAHSCAVEPLAVPNVLITDLQPASVCPETDVLFQTTVIEGQGPFTYAWTFDDGSGPVAIPGAASSSLLVPSASAADAGTYCVSVTGQCGVDSSCATLSVKSGLVLADLQSQSVCEGEDVTFNAQVLSGAGPFTYQWSFAGAPIPGANGSSLSVPDVTPANAGLYCVRVSGECGADEACAELSVEVCGGGEEFCTLTQGAYGSAGGAGNLAQINGLLTTDLVVGKPGRSLRILAGSGDCVLLRLPANSTSATLPAFGDATLSASTCQTSPTALPLKNGRFKNVFLGQVITLSLNTRLSPTLPGLGLCPSMTSDKDLVLLGDELTVSIPADVFTSLAAQSLPLTVGGLLELANRALAGQGTAPADLSEINGAVDAINRLFDECRTLIACE